jgi:diacylglycerol kinase
MRRFFYSFMYAGSGLLHGLKKERNFRLHVIAMVIVIIVAGILQVSNTEWLILLLNISAVLTLELMNSCIERVCNIIHPQHNKLIKIIKDMAAAAVLIAALVAAVAAGIIFIPKLSSS